MKQNLILLFFMVFSGLHVQSQTEANAFDYLSAISGLQQGISHANMAYFRCAVHCPNQQDVENNRLELLQQVEQALASTQRMPAFNGESTLRDEAVVFLQAMLSNCKGDYVEINQNFLSPDDPFGAMEEYYRLVEQAERKLDRANDRFERYFNNFARDNNIQIIEDDNGESEVQLANRINAYARDINKLEFNLQKRLNDVIEGLEAQSYRKLETARFNLAQEADRVRYALEQLSDFDGDDQLRTAALRFTLIMQDLANKHLPAMVDHMRSPKNETVDAYNGAVEFFNTTVIPANGFMAEAKDAFMKAHVPKPGRAQRKI